MGSINRPSGTEIANEAERQRTDWSGIIIIVGCAAIIAAPYLVMAWRLP